MTMTMKLFQQIKPVVQERHTRKTTMTLSADQVCAILAKYVGQEAGINPARAGVTENVSLQLLPTVSVQDPSYHFVVELTEDLMAGQESAS